MIVMTAMREASEGDDSNGENQTKLEMGERGEKTNKKEKTNNMK